MSKPHPIALLAGFACLLGFASGARAGVTVDVLFQDGTGRGLTITGGDYWAPGCSFGGYYGRSVSTGRCMDVVLTTTQPLLGFGVGVDYDTRQRARAREHDGMDRPLVEHKGRADCDLLPR